MRITDDARDALGEVFKENNANNIRVYFAGYGWSQPNIGLALDEPEADDKVVSLNCVQVAIDPRIENYLDELVLEFDHNKSEFYLSGNDDDCC